MTCSACGGAAVWRAKFSKETLCSPCLRRLRRYVDDYDWIRGAAEEACDQVEAPWAPMPRPKRIRVYKTREAIREYKKGWMRAQLAKRRAANVCVFCGRERVPGSRAYCKRHLLYLRRRGRERSGFKPKKGGGPGRPPIRVTR